MRKLCGFFLVGVAIAFSQIPFFQQGLAVCQAEQVREFASADDEKPASPSALPGVSTPSSVPLSNPQAGDVWKEPVTGMEFVWVPGGCFMMGQTQTEKKYLIKKRGQEEYNDEYFKCELPRHEVCVDGFWMGKYEVTNWEYRMYKSGHDSKSFKGDNLNGDDQPVVEVSWEDAKRFIQWLNQKNGQSFALPTEAQWEYAARAGTSTMWYWGDSESDACQYANVYDKNQKAKSSFSRSYQNCNDGYAGSAPVGRFDPNGFGLYDMLGNVWEWCEDEYDCNAYSKHDRNNPLVISGSKYRVRRGGSWFGIPENVRSASRLWSIQEVGNLDFGFRLALNQKTEQTSCQAEQVREFTSADDEKPTSSSALLSVSTPSSVPPSNPRAGDMWKEPVTGMEFVWVPKGCFQMGSNFGESYEGQKPVHEVCLDGFWVGKYEVTQGQWEKIMGSNPSYFKYGDDFPVEEVSWNDAKTYIEKLSRQSGQKFALPTEAQWEYAARSGGKREKYAGGNDVESVAWYAGNSGHKTHRVGTKAPNGLGIYDMSGNVREWCEDVYDGNAYSRHARNNPLVTSGSKFRVVRNGSWNYYPRLVRSAYRLRALPDSRNNDLGFRLALHQETKQTGPVESRSDAATPPSTTQINKSEWTINESEGKVNLLFSIDSIQKDAFQKSDSPLWGMRAFLFPTQFGDNPRVCIGFRGFGGEGADLFTMEEINQERKKSEVRSVGMRPMKVNDVWIKFDIIGILGETTDTAYFPKTQGDLNELICVFINSTEVNFNSATYTTNGFIKTFKQYNKMLNYKTYILDYCKKK